MPVADLRRRASRFRTATTGGWLVVALVVVAALAAAGGGPLAILTFGAVWLASTTVPGVLVWRALSRPTSIVQELGFGSVVGIGLLLLAWLPATLLGHPLLMWLWPIGVATAYVAVPSLRRHLRPHRAPEHLTPGRWQLVMMGVSALGFLRLWATALRTEILPPHQSTVFQDVWYEIALTQHLRHAVAISDPAVAGVPLKYHWFSNAHAAAVRTLSGSTTAEVVMHLWPAAMLFTFVFVVAAAVERILEGTGKPSMSPALTSRWWAGPLAALLAAVFPVTLYLGWPRVPGIDNGFISSSTSGILALTIILALVGPVLDLLYHGPGCGSLVLLGVLLVLSTGSKPSILPVVACGSALAAVVQWVQTRHFPTAAAVLTLACLVLIPLSALAVIGSTGGSRLQLFDVLMLDPAYGQATGAIPRLPGRGGWLAPGLEGGFVHVWGVAAGLLLIYTLTELPRLLGILGLGDRTLRSDPGVWWCSGVLGSGYCGLWVLAHPAYSQHYFWRIVVGLGVVLTVTTAVRLLPPRTRWSGVRPDVVAYGVGGLVAGLAAVAVRSPAESVARRLLPYAAALVIFLVLLAVRRFGPARFRAGRRLPVLVLASVFFTLSSAPVTVGSFARSVGPALVGVQPRPGPSARYLSADEQKAGMWLEGHSAVDDVVATNVFCAPSLYVPGCRHVAFWVAALTGRQLYYGAWAYTKESLSAYSHQSTDYQTSPPPRPDRLAHSLGAVRAPTPEVVAKLREQGVSWIFADRRATRISPDLGRYATLAYQNADVRIYRLSD